MPPEGLPIGSDGFEDQSAVFAQEPASVPPVKRTKSTPGRRRGANVEDEEDYDEGSSTMTAAYPGRRTANQQNSRRQSNITSIAETSASEEEESDEQDEGADTTVGTTVSPQQGRRAERSRPSLPQSDYGQYDGDATRLNDGTQDMDIEGSEYSNPARLWHILIKSGCQARITTRVLESGRAEDQVEHTIQVLETSKA